MVRLAVEIVRVGPESRSSLSRNPPASPSAGGLRYRNYKLLTANEIHIRTIFFYYAILSSVSETK